MRQAVRITDLPGVGRRLEFEVEDQLVAVVITYRGDRQLFVQIAGPRVEVEQVQQASS